MGWGAMKEDVEERDANTSPRYGLRRDRQDTDMKTGREGRPRRDREEGGASE